MQNIKNAKYLLHSIYTHISEMCLPEAIIKAIVYCKLYVNFVFSGKSLFIYTWKKVKEHFKP